MTTKVAKPAIQRVPVEIDIAAVAQRLPLYVDTPGILYVEGVRLLAKATTCIDKLNKTLKAHELRVQQARATKNADAAGDAWIDVIQYVGSMESFFGRAIRDFAIADMLLVTAAEAYVNAVASHELEGSEFDQFDILSPVGKWIFLPRLLKLKWRPKFGSAPLQQFAALVARRNRAVHPKPIKVVGVSEVQEFITRLKLDAKSATEGATSVKELIRQFCLSWKGSYGPDWLEIDHAKKRPPCFIFGSLDAPARLGYKRRQRRGDA